MQNNLLKRYTIGASIFFVLAGCVLIPYLHRREATRIVTTIIKLWQHGDLVESYYYWETPEKSPPIYGVNSYKITKKLFFKNNNSRAAKIFIVLDFPPDNLMPTNKEWIFELRQTRHGWKIIDFYLNKKNS